MSDVNAIGAASLAISQSVIAFTAFLPQFTEIKRGTMDALHSDVRLGEMAAVTTACGIGILLSWLTKSHIPAIVSVMVSFMLVMLYETALRNEVTT